MSFPPTSRYAGNLRSVENADGRIGTQTSYTVRRSSVSTLPIVRASGSTALTAFNATARGRGS
eukprot:9845055-Heterocapsa_arctica.AAC.1